MIIKCVIGVVSVILMVGAIVMIFFLSNETDPPIIDPPCSELTWMRDLPQARCKEYWKQRNIEESKDATIYEQ